jgi:hypothetical protein
LSDSAFVNEWVWGVGKCESHPLSGLTVGVLIGADGDPLAEEQRDGYELALEEANADGGPAGCPLSLVYMPEEVSGSSTRSIRLCAVCGRTGSGRHSGRHIQHSIHCWRPP